jgi:hypothetical protein
MLSMMTTDQKGAIAETAIALLAARLGIGVYRPVVEGGRYDLILEVAGELYRTQCKLSPRIANVLVVRCYSSRRAREGLRRRLYTSEEVDVIAAYNLELDWCLMIPAARFAGHPELRFRLDEAANNQRVAVNRADDYGFERLHWASPGAIAQLGERVAGSHEVAGSSPAGSTSPVG